MSQERTGWTGWIVFAGVMMVIIGIWHAIAGFAAILKKDFYAVSPNYVFKLSSNGWGWIHLIMGIVIALAGLALMQGAVWARTIGVLLAIISSIAAFAWMPYYPVWAIIIITVDIFVIFALTAHGRDLADSV